MAALTDNLIRQTQSLTGKKFIVKSGVTVYAGSLVALESSTGHIEPIADATTDQVYLGVCQQKVVGDGSLKATVSLDEFILPSVAVTGASAMTDIGSLVYATTDNTLTLARPADDACPVGRVLYWHSSTTCDVAMFGIHDSFNLSAQGRGRQVLYIGSATLAGAAGNVITGYELHGHGKIVDFFTFDTETGTGAGADQDYNLEINGTDVTGGVLSILLANMDGTTPGGKTSATAITANNEFHDGDLLDVEMVENTTFTGGTAPLFIEIEPLP